VSCENGDQTWYPILFGCEKSESVLLISPVVMSCQAESGIEPFKQFNPFNPFKSSHPDLKLRESSCARQ
jgi:hypothetical protein